MFCFGKGVKDGRRGGGGGYRDNYKVQNVFLMPLILVGRGALHDYYIKWTVYFW